MQHVAVSWLVYRLTGSALILGLIAFSNQFPAFIVAPFAGALADRWSRYRMVVAAQIAAMAQAIVLAALVLTGTVQVWHLVALSAVAGLITGMELPARQALLVRLVRGTEDLPNAIALNSSLFNSARLVGPAIAGMLIGMGVGEGPVFVLNAVSYLGVLGALAALQLTEEPGEPAGPVLRNIARGFGYAFRFEPIRDLLSLLALVSLVGIPYVVLLPVFATDILGGGASTLGLLTSCAGFGAALGALLLASRDTVVGLGRVIVRASALFGAALLTFAFSEILWLSCALLVATGFAVMVVTASINTMLPDPRRRSHAWSRHEPLHHGLHRNVPPGQPGGRRHCHALRSSAGRLAGRAGVPGPGDVVQPATRPAPGDRAPRLRAHGHLARGGPGPADRQHDPAEELASRYGSLSAASMFGICTTMCCLPPCMKVLRP